MFSRVEAVTFDCADPAGLAEFWCAVLGYHVTNSGQSTDGTAFAEIGPARGVADGPTLFFEQVPEGANHGRKNPVHLDIAPPVGKHQEELARILTLGAQKSEMNKDLTVSWVILLDPEGNEFCLLNHDQPSTVEG